MNDLFDDRGFLFGDGLFETIRVDRGQVRWLDLHLARLRQSGKELAFPEELIEEAVLALESTLDQKEGIWRVTVTRDGQDMAFGGSGHVHLRHRPFPELIRPRLNVMEGFFHPADLMARYKTTSYIRYVEARRRARVEGFDDALLTSPQGLIGETSAANVFIVFDGEVATPPLEGILDGVTRRGLLDEYPEIVVREIGIEELDRAREIALVSAGIGVLAARSLLGRPLDEAWSRSAQERLP